MCAWQSNYTRITDKILKPRFSVWYIIRFFWKRLQFMVCKFLYKNEDGWKYTLQKGCIMLSKLIAVYLFFANLLACPYQRILFAPNSFCFGFCCRPISKELEKSAPHKIRQIFFFDFSKSLPCPLLFIKMIRLYWNEWTKCASFNSSEIQWLSLSRNEIIKNNAWKLFINFENKKKIRPGADFHPNYT